MPGDIGESLLQEMLTTSLSLPVARVAVLGVEQNVTDGNGYTSDMSRLRARVVTEDGKRREVSLLVKQCILDQVDNEVLKELAELTTEIKMYKEVLPAMEGLMLKVDGSVDAPWPHCIGHYHNTTLVLEDLRELGYETRDRTRGLDYPHAAVAVRGIARFHATSAALHSAGKLQPEDFSKFIFTSGSTAINGFITSSFEYLNAVARMEWSPEWRDVIEKVGRIPAIAVEKLGEITKLEDKGFHVLNHGDLWVNNMMFRHKEDGTPDSLRLVDFQLSHYNSYAFDLHYFMNTSLSIEVLHHIDRLYEEYHQALREELTKLDLAALCPGLPEVLEELQRTEFFGLFSAVCIAPVITADPEIAPPKESKGFSLGELEARKKERFRTWEYTKKIQIILRRAQHGGTFKRIFI